MDNKTDQIITEIVAKYPRRLPSEGIRDLRQFLWETSLRWNGDGELKDALQTAAYRFIGEQRRLIRIRSLDHPGETERVGAAYPSFYNTPEHIDLNAALDRLPADEAELARLLADGYNADDIAKELNRSRRWVFYHQPVVLEKLKKYLGESYAR